MTATPEFGAPQRFTARPGDVEALQFVYRKVGKAQILAFCPHANIGAPVTDDTNIRWITLHTNGVLAEVGDGDWIVRHGDRTYEVLSDAEFAKRFTPAEYSFAEGAWWLVQYTPNLHRLEPRNIGVALAVSDDRVTGRFLGFDHNGEPDPTEMPALAMVLGEQPDLTYRSWINYYHRAISTDTWVRALTENRRRPNEFRIRLAGRTFDSTKLRNSQQHLANLHTTLVLPAP